MKYLLMLIPLLFLITTTSANATDYYYCDCQTGASGQCVAGNDSNNGTSTSSPRQTFSNANTTFNRFAAGDSIQFCRGGSFTANKTHRWTNNKCTTSNTCTVTSYDLPGQVSSQLAQPIITQTNTGHLFDLNDGASANSEEGYIFNNLDLRCTAGCTGGANYGFFFYNDVNHVTISNLSIDGFGVGIHLALGSGTHDFITLQNLTIINNTGQGILGGANDLNIKDSRFENNGGGTNRDHNLYLSRGNNITVSGNDLYRSSVDANNVCQGTPLVVHGIVNNMLIENNIIREDIGKAGRGCTGISIAPGYTKDESFTNIMIRGNKLINIGAVGIGIGSCDTCIIENNVILQQQPSFAFNAIKAPTKSRSAGDIALNKVTIRNNSIYTSSSGTGINLGLEGTQHTVVSNAIHYTGTEKFTCFNLGLATSAYTAIDNNTCYFPNALASSEWEAGSGTNPNPLGAWQGLSGVSVNSQNVNPEFKDPSLPQVDLSPQNISSAIVGAGHNTSSPKDYRGKTRDAQPDAGAFEFGTFNPPAKTNIYPN